LGERFPFIGNRTNGARGSWSADRYLAEFDFRFGTRTALGYNDHMRAEMAARASSGSVSSIDGLTSKVRPQRIKRQATRFLQRRKK
jgi:hypothetical protein